MQVTLMDPQEFQDWINEVHASKSAADNKPIDAPKIFHKGHEAETKAFDDQYQKNQQQSPYTAADRSFEYSANMRERLDIQMRFESNFKKIEKQFDKPMAAAEERYKAGVDSLLEHAKNHNAAKDQYVESQLKLEAATARHEQRETEYKQLVHKYGTPDELKEKTSDANRALDGAEQKADNARQSLASYYASQGSRSAEDGLVKHLESARQENNQALSDARSTVKTASVSSEWTASNGETFNSSERETAVSLSWRDRLANVVDAAGAPGMADYIRGTDELKTKQIAVDKSFDERQGNLQIAATKAVDPDVKERLQGQQAFEKANRDLVKMKEMQKVGGDDSFALKQNIEKTTNKMLDAAEQMARADTRLAEKGVHVELKDNQPHVVSGKADQVNVIETKLNHIDNVANVSSDRAQAVAEQTTVSKAAQAISSSENAKANIAGEVNVAGIKVADAKADLAEVKDEALAALASRQSLRTEQQEVVNQIQQTRDDSMARIDKREAQQTLTQESNMARSEPQNPAAERHAARLNAVESKPKQETPDRAKTFVAEARAREHVISDKQSDKQTDTAKAHQ